MTHVNAPLTPTGRLRLARCIVEDGWLPARAAERFGVSLTTARRWSARYRELGTAGMSDRSSRPRHSPRQTSRRRARRVVGLRVARRWGPAKIAYHLGMHPSTVHKILSRYGCVRLAFTDPATGARVRASTRKVHSFEHPAAGFWERAAEYFASAGITVRRVLTDNGPCYRSNAFAGALGERITHKRTRPYRPQTNGKVERYNRTMLEEWAYATAYLNETERAKEFPDFLHRYNHHRGHTALRGATPADRVPNLRDQHS